jgi:hypothetical protein
MGQIGIAPDGFEVCDGRSIAGKGWTQLETLLGGTNTPDLRGVVLRGYDPGHVRDPQGGARYAGHIQGDAMRELAGQITSPLPADQMVANGVFTAEYGGTPHTSGLIFTDGGIFTFKASNVVPIDSEFRMVNACILFCIKHD